MIIYTKGSLNFFRFLLLFKVILITAVVITCTSLCHFLEQFKSRFQIRSQVFIDKANFYNDWAVLQAWRMEWENMLKSCEGNLSWDNRNVQSDLRTDHDKSYIKRMELGKAGSFSRFWIQSLDIKGRHKSIGGDSWRVYIREGPSSISPIIIDRNDGVYEVLMLIVEPGIYQANIYLDYTLCDGLREPPSNWFIYGTDHGTYLNPQDGCLGNIEKDYIKLPLGNQEKHTFRISGYYEENQQRKQTFVKKDNELPCLVWDGHGYWKEHQWFPYKQDTNVSQHIDVRPYKRTGTLWVYGDSLGMRFTESIRTHRLCNKIFNNCVYTYNWIYEVKDKRHPLKIRTKFNKTVILNKIRQILQRKDINQPSSVFLLSLGVHFPISLTFREYKDLVDSVILLLKQRVNGIKLFQGIVVWKTTAALEREKITRKPWPAKQLNYTMFRFLTPQRNQLFHSYSMNAMCQAGVPVLDVYPLTASYHGGTLDYVHYNASVFYPAERALERFIFKHRQRNL